MLILFYNSFFGSPPSFVDCGADVTFTTDRRQLADADAVVFHLPGAREIGEARKYPGQVWVAWSMESTVNTPMLQRPDLMRHFDLTMTFSRNSDVWNGYIPPRSEWEAALARPLPPQREATPLVMFQSATIDRCGRNDFCAELMRHLPVDSYGRFLNNRRIENDRGHDTKREVIGSYRFALGAENTFETDYVTEKFHLAEDEAEYASYLAWRTQPLRPAFLRLLEACDTHPLCRLAESVARHPRSGAGNPMPFGPARYARAKLIRAVRALRAIRAKIRA